MDSERKSKLKSSKKRDRGPLLKPDVMLITKDVMVPVKLPPPSTRLFPTARSGIRNKLRMEKGQRLSSQSLKPLLSSGIVEKNYTRQSLPQVKETASGKKVGEETVPRSWLYYLSRDNNENQKNVYVNETEAIISLKREDSNLDLFDSDPRDRRNVETANISEVEKTPTLLSRNSTSSVTTSAETRSYSSSKSLDMIEDSLPKLPLSIISSSESEINIRALDCRATSVNSRIPSEDNITQDLVAGIVENNVFKDLESEIRCNSNLLSDPNDELSTEIINKEFTESILSPELGDWSQNSNTYKGFRELVATDVEKLIIDPNNDQNQEEAAENDVDANDFEDSQILMDVEYVLQNLLTNLETLGDFDSSDNCDGSDEVEEKKSSEDNLLNIREEILNKSDYNFNERIPKMVEFSYSSQDLSNIVLTLDDNDDSFSERLDIDLGRRYSSQELNLPNSTVTGIKNDEQSEIVYNNLDINSNQSDEQIEIKYSWQIITTVNQELNDINTHHNESIYAKNSKLTSTEDLCLNKPEFRYSWQKLTSKYLAGKHAEDSLTDTNQPVRNINDIPKNKCVKDYSSLRGTCSHFNRNLNKEEKRKVVGDIGRIVTNSPLNNIISSMLPEIKLINRRISFNDTTPEIIGNYRDKKASNSHSSASSIKHVIESLNEMVATQKHMLDAHVKNHELDKNFNVTGASVNPVEKVEIFPSTLHVLGSYIVRDIHPADMNEQRNLLASSNNENIQDNSVTVQNTRLDKPVENVLHEKIPAPIVKPAIIDADFPSLLGHPIPSNSDCYSVINLSPEIENQDKGEPDSCTSEENRSSLLLPVLGYERILTENNWEPAIADMEEMIGLSLGAARHMNEGKDDGNEAVPHTKNTGPLTPRVQVSFSEIKEVAGESNIRKDELLARLEGAMNKLKQSEQHVDANWNLDYSVLDIEESISDKAVQLPKQVEEHIKDIIKSAEEYLGKLEEQLNDLRSADDQIINSSERTFKEIDDTYQLFMDNLCQEINKRRNLVRLETEVFKYEGLAPLRACKQEVDAQIRSTQHLIVLTENMLTHPITFNKERLGKIITATSHMGRIPAVPMPEELPYVTFSPPNEEIKKEVVDRISCLGCVLRMGPAQFTEVFERPACLQLKWHVVDPEYASEEQTFIVQKALGEIAEPNSPAFETVYVGQEMSCFVRGIPVDHRITLRVGIQVTDTAWSVHRIAQTTIPAYSWDTNNSDYLITNSGRIATKVTQNLSTLLSQSSQFSANYIIEFKFLEAASGSDDEGIGLVFEPGGASETLKRNGALLITPNGNIFMNGEQKLMQLPKMELGTRIVFTSEQKDEETLRMTIECANKAVTYDWTVQTPLNFGARFSEPNKWNLMVK